MKKGKMKLKTKVKSSNRLVYFLVTLGILVLVGVGVYAYGTTNPAAFGHTMGEMAPPSPCTANQYLQFDGTNWKCVGLPAPPAETDPTVRNWAKTDTPTISGVITASSNINVAGTANIGYYYASGFCTSCTSLPIGCPSGMHILGGGCSSSTSNPSTLLVKSFPNSDNSWQCDYFSATRITVYVICARMG